MGRLIRPPRRLPAAVLALAALLGLAGTASAAGPGGALDLSYLEVTGEFDFAAADRGEFLRRFAAGRFDAAAAEAACAANAAHLATLAALFGDLDPSLRYRSYRDIRVTGLLPADEYRALLGLPLAAALLAHRDGRPVDFARTVVTGMHFAACLLAGRGIEGEGRKAEFAEALVPLLAEHFRTGAFPPALVPKFREYLDWFATAGLDAARMYESERVQIIGKYFPMYKGDLEREVPIFSRIEDIFPDLAQDARFWEYKEAENLILRFHRLVRHPLPKRLYKFRAADAERAKKKPVAKHLGFQVTAMMRVERAAQKLELASAAAAALAFRAAKGRFPADAAELAAAGHAVPADRFGDGPVKVVGKGNLLVVYSIGPNFIDDIYARDDLVVRLERAEP